MRTNATGRHTSQSFRLTPTPQIVKLSNSTNRANDVTNRVIEVMNRDIEIQNCAIEVTNRTIEVISVLLR